MGNTSCWGDREELDNDSPKAVTRKAKITEKNSTNKIIKKNKRKTCKKLEDDSEGSPDKSMYYFNIIF